MKKLINFIFNKILKLGFKVDENIPNSYLFSLLVSRLFMLIRGFFVSFPIKKSGKFFFVDKRTTLKCKRKLYVGNRVTIQSEVYIDALSLEGIHIGNNVSIGRRTTIKTSGSLKSIGKGFWIGDYSAIGNDCYIGAAGGVSIGNYVAIGQSVRFHSENHEFNDRNKKISEQGVTNKGIVVKDDCWIGAGSVILDGVEIGEGSVVGANSIVTSSVPEYSIVVGSPARVVGYRGQS